MPVQKIWDHAIELKEGFTPRKGKVYSLSREEREEVQTFVEDQLRKGYIRPSKSPQILPVHFMVKKDGTWRMVQDYRHINQWTIKKWVLFTPHCRYIRWSRKEKGVYEVEFEMGIQ